MKIAIITPYFKESILQIRRCIDSVKMQTVEVTHFLIADGSPIRDLENAGVRHIILDKNHGDWGNTPRAVAGILAVSEGYEAIGYLDADNWIDSDHVMSCITAANKSIKSVDFVIAKRRWVNDHREFLPYKSPEDLSGRHADTNCIFLMKNCLHLASQWGVIPHPLSQFGDRLFFYLLQTQGYQSTYVNHETVNYLCTWRDIYVHLGLEVPSYAKPGLDIAKAKAWWDQLSPIEKKIFNKRLGFELKL